MTPVAPGARNLAPDLLGPERLGARATVLPAAAQTALSEHLVGSRNQHQRDLDQGAGWIELPPAPTTKLPTAGREQP